MLSCTPVWFKASTAAPVTPHPLEMLQSDASFCSCLSKYRYEQYEHVVQVDPVRNLQVPTLRSCVAERPVLKETVLAHAELYTGVIPELVRGRRGAKALQARLPCTEQGCEV